MTTRREGNEATSILDIWRMIKIRGMVDDASVVFNDRMGKPEEQTTGNPHFGKIASALLSLPIQMG